MKVEEIEYCIKCHGQLFRGETIKALACKNEARDRYGLITLAKMPTVREKE